MKVAFLIQRTSPPGVSVTDQLITTECSSCHTEQNLQAAKISAEDEVTIYRCFHCNETMIAVVPWPDPSWIGDGWQLDDGKIFTKAELSIGLAGNTSTLKMGGHANAFERRVH